jgi:hypothetical protein
MRLAPIPLFYFKTPSIGIEYADRSASLTHANKKAIDACRYYAALIIGAINGFNKEQILDKNFYLTNKTWFGEQSLHEDIRIIAEGSFKRKGGYQDGIRGKGYVVNALEAALWAFWSDEGSFEKGALAAVNLGDDTDTTAAIYGQLAGAYYGYKQIPQEWRDKLYAHNLLVCMGEWIHFQGYRRGLEHLEYQHAIAISQQQNEQQTVSTSVASLSDHSKTDEDNDTFNKNIPYSKQISTNNESKSKPHLTRATSLDSAANTSTNRVVSPKDVHPELTNFKLSRKTEPNDEFTRTTHEHAFYRNRSNQKDFQ